IQEERLIAMEKAKDTVGNIIEFMEYIQTGTFRNICVVSTIEHLPRAWMSLYTALQKSGYEANLFAAAPEETIDPESLKTDMQFTYQTVCRIAGFFTKKEIENLI